MENENMNLNDGESVNKVYRRGMLTGALMVVSLIMMYVCGSAIKTTFSAEMPHQNKIKYIHNLLDKCYVEDIPEGKINEGIYSGMVSMPTDRYSYYMNKDTYSSFKDSSEGNYFGIGVLVTIDPDDMKILVNAVFENSPSEKAGIAVGDKILKVNGVEVGADNYDDAITMIKGPKDSTVTLSIYKKSEDQYMDVVVTRNSVEMPTVASKMLDNGVGYIIIGQFDGVTSKQFENAYDSLKSQGMQKLVLDLRGNPGGLLNVVRDVADVLLPEGVLTYTENKQGKKEYEYTKGDGCGIPISVLINGNSASASELLAGAIKDLKAGTLVGTTSYGKGVVQTIFPLRDGSAVKITTARYYTPNNICIDGVGVEPDVVLEAKKDFEMPILQNKNAVVDLDNDLQLQKAIEILK